MTILQVAKRQGIDIPTMCWERTLTPVNACRVCVCEVKGSRVLVPSCARKVEEGMEVETHSERVNALAARWSSSSSPRPSTCP